MLVSDPSWENHQALFTRAGLKVATYRYYDADAHGIDFAGMLDDLGQGRAGDHRGAASVPATTRPATT